jgi:hypothetical protein
LTFFRNTLTGNDLKASGPTGSPLSTTDVAAIQTDRDGRSGFRRVFDLELASGVESELLGAQFRLYRGQLTRIPPTPNSSVCKHRRRTPGNLKLRQERNP